MRRLGLDRLRADGSNRLRRSPKHFDVLCDHNGSDNKEAAMTVTVFIRYQLDPFKWHHFETYAKRWLDIIPRCGGDVIGYFLPHEGTNNIAYGLIAFDSLSSYEAYRALLKSDPEATANFGFAERHQCILVEERTFLRNVERVPST
jgi:hypothetical protein